MARIRLLRSFLGILGAWQTHIEGMAAWLLLSTVPGGGDYHLQSFADETWSGNPGAPHGQSERSGS